MGTERARSWFDWPVLSLACPEFIEGTGLPKGAPRTGAAAPIDLEPPMIYVRLPEVFLLVRCAQRWTQQPASGYNCSPGLDSGLNIVHIQPLIASTFL